MLPSNFGRTTAGKPCGRRENVDVAHDALAAILFRRIPAALVRHAWQIFAVQRQ